MVHENTILVWLGDLYAEQCGVLDANNIIKYQQEEHHQELGDHHHTAIEGVKSTRSIGGGGRSRRCIRTKEVSSVKEEEEHEA
jgi:hypothetical protein